MWPEFCRVIGVLAGPWPWCHHALVAAPHDVIIARLAQGLDLGGRHVEVPSETIRILRERIVDGWAVLHLEFEDSEGQLWDGVAGAIYDDAQQRWRQSGAAYGGRERRADPDRGRRVNLRSFSRNPTDDRCCLGGRVYDPTVHRVTVLDENGMQATDAVSDGVALLISEGAFGEPKTIALYDTDGRLLESRPFDWSD